MDDKRLNPIIETSYLTASNAWRYRMILRYFFIQHESMRHFILPGEIHAYLRDIPHFADYSEEQLQQDLQQLTEWKNIIARQETSRVSTIEEFKKKRFRYQASPYTIEIERMVRRLENLGESFGGSLERTLFDRLLAALNRFLEADGEINKEELNALWEDIFDSFRKLTDNATDYLAHLHSEKVEELMMTEAFLAYKEALSDYLRNFVTAMQRASLKIQTTLDAADDQYLIDACQRLADYQLSIPRLDGAPDRLELIAKYHRQWDNLQVWFVGGEGRTSDLYLMQTATHEAIRRITRFAQRLGERHHNHKSRRKDYQELARRFAACSDLDAAHRLSACVFGLANTRHIYAPVKDTEDIYAEVWDRAATKLTVRPMVKNYRLKTRTNAVRDNREQKAAMLAEHLAQKQTENQLLDSLIDDGRIELEGLGIIEPYVRKTLLVWISRCLAVPTLTTKTETGRSVKLHTKSGRVILRATDGNLDMPNYTLEITE
ncbi:MAG: TIGR02677 family protein [Firmicutes bacterium]|nr:TIGR02677 family protein [Bacillota bacterium]